MTNASDTIERTLRIAARPEIVFSFFTDPAKMVRWLGTQCRLDPRPGGVYRVELNPNHIQRGQYVEVTPYTRIVFTWGWEGENVLVPPGSSTVEVSLVPDGSDTVLHLVHSGLPLVHGGTAAGWDRHLEKLVIAAEGREIKGDEI